MPTTGRRRWAMIILVIVAAAACLCLGWWQWTRYESVGGSFQNLGYALQWPFFAGFCVYAYRKFVQYEQSPPQPAHSSEVTEIPEGLLPQRRSSGPQIDQDDDPALRAYNAYLAELARKDRPDRTTA